MQKYIYLFLSAAIMLGGSCHKEWLDIKRDKKQVVPSSLKDLEALIGNSEVMTESMPYLGEFGSADFCLEESRVTALNELLRPTYLWTDDPYGDMNVPDWDNRHEQIYYANTVLAGLDRLSDKSHTAQWQELRGSALFYRAWAVYQLAQLFCKPYDPATANADPGIPFLREADVNLRAKRGTVQQTYDQIVRDLEEALPLLVDRPVVKTRPGKAAVYGLLARVMLVTARYEEALSYAEQALSVDDTLIDYNDLDTLATAPFERFNAEVVFRSTMSSNARLRVPYFNLDPDFYASFEAYDLRRRLFFNEVNSQMGFKGSYDGGTTFFTGIAVDELYLIVAECQARIGKPDEAVSALNHLLEHRYKKDHFVPYETMPEEELLKLIINERRKELCFRGLRWTDIRRLNIDPKQAIKLSRTVAGQVYELSAENPNYVLFIPEKEVLLNPMEQNLRY